MTIVHANTDDDYFYIDNNLLVNMGNKSSKSTQDKKTADSGLVVRPIQKEDFSKGTLSWSR